MPYASNADLPKPVRDNIPAQAQEIYREAFNSAWDQYARREARRSRHDRREVAAHKAAWSAVKKVYRKEGNRWVRRETISAVSESR